MYLKVSIVLAMTAIALPAAAQEMPTIDYNGALDHARTTGRLVRQAQARQNHDSPAARRKRAQAVCANKKRIATRLTAAQAREMYSLCARARY